MAYHQTHYPKHRILSNISLDLAFALIVNLVVVLRFIQQRRLSLSVGHIIGNVAIGTSAIIITCWVAFSTYERVVYIKWAEAPASGILNQDGINTSTSSMKVPTRLPPTSACSDHWTT